MSRRPPEDRGAVVTLHKQGLAPAEICRKTGFDYHFVTRWIAKHNESGSLDDAKRAGRPRKLSKSVELTVERKMRKKRRRSSRVIARELKRQKVCDVSYTTVQRTVHRRGLHAFKQKTSRLSQAHKRGRLRFAKTNIKRDWSNVVFSGEHTFKQFKGGNPRHNFVWAKSVSEVPGKEVERWGLAVNTWAGFSSRGKTKLTFYEGTRVPKFCRRSCCLLRKSGMKTKRQVGNCNRTRRLVTRQSPPRVGWSSMGLLWWKGGPLRALTLIRWRTFGRSLTRDLRTKSLRQKKE